MGAMVRPSAIAALKASNYSIVVAILVLACQEREVVGYGDLTYDGPPARTRRHLWWKDGLESAPRTLLRHPW